MNPTADESLIFSCRIARTENECSRYFSLRREIFCAEQGLFASDDRDAWDGLATPIVCLAASPRDNPGAVPRLAGVVRIWEEAPGDWWGGRLGVAAEFRTAAVVGRRLIQHAVGTARAWGAWRFRATVQKPNVAFFRRLRWDSIGQLELLGRPHDLMEACLDRYVPTGEIRGVPGIAGQVAAKGSKGEGKGERSSAELSGRDAA